MDSVKIERIGGKTKLTYRGRQFYGIKNIETEGERMFITTGNNVILDFAFNQVIDTEGTSNAEELADFYSANDFFLEDNTVSYTEAESLKERLLNLENRFVKAVWYEIHNEPTNGAVGQITPPQNGTLTENGWGIDLTGIVKQIDQGTPTNEDVPDNDPGTAEAVLAVTVDPQGVYTILGNCDLVLYPAIAIVYQYRIKLKDYNSDFDLNDITEPVIDQQKFSGLEESFFEHEANRENPHEVNEEQMSASQNLTLLFENSLL